MHRDQRRHNHRRQCTAAMLKLQKRVEASGEIGVSHGLTGGCRDCDGDAAIVVMPGHRAIGHVFHSTGCPAAAGITAWQPVPISEGESA